jgi:hypothetical protein
MGQISLDLLKKIASARATGGGTIIRDGIYRFMIHKMMIEKKWKGVCFIVEFEVIDAKPAIDGVAPNPVGSVCGYVVNLDRNPSAPGNTKALILGLLGIDESKITNAAGQPASEDEQHAQIAECVAWAISEQNPCRGMLLDDVTFRKEIQSGANAGKPFTGHNWARVDQTPEQVAARRAEIDLKVKKAA